jgi:hypothetical protein
MTKDGTGRRTITIVTTTWTIRWWDGETWVEQTLAPSVEVVSGREENSNPVAAARDAAPELQEPKSEPDTNQQTDQPAQPTQGE